MVGATALVSLGLVLGACSSREPLTLTYLDPEWSHDMQQERRAISDAALQEFTRETGIFVKHLPAPETSRAQLELVRQLLQKESSSPDVYGIDVIWPGILSEYLIDLRPYFTQAELTSQDPEVLANYTVKEKLVAMPYHANIGVLFYRTDLLERYGYREPPKTWDQLETMAARIQQGERARGEKDFWGYVWPGAASEGLTCNALEWQVAEGGGRIIEANAKISVNNPDSIHAWERAAHWVGWISPASTPSYQEWDSTNAFWNSGRAAFNRGWMSDYFVSHPPVSPVRDKSGITSVPGGKGLRAATLGGLGLAVPLASVHRAEAIRLVQFLLRREAQLEDVRAHSDPPRPPELYELPTLLVAYARRSDPGGEHGGGVVVRPSTITGEKYDEVARAYIRAVHSVLTGKSPAPQAAAALEMELSGITGFQAGSPEGKF